MNNNICFKGQDSLMCRLPSTSFKKCYIIFRLIVSKHNVSNAVNQDTTQIYPYNKFSTTAGMSYFTAVWVLYWAMTLKLFESPSQKGVCSIPTITEHFNYVMKYDNVLVESIQVLNHLSIVLLVLCLCCHLLQITVCTGTEQYLALFYL